MEPMGIGFRVSGLGFRGLGFRVFSIRRRYVELQQDFSLRP